MTDADFIDVHPGTNIEILSSVCIDAAIIRNIFSDSIRGVKKRTIISTINDRVQLIGKFWGRIECEKNAVINYLSGVTVCSITQSHSLTKSDDFYHPITAAVYIVSANPYRGTGKSSL